MEKHKNFLLLMMGGKGTRFQNDIPKQYSFVNGLPIYLYILRRYNVMKNIDHIVIVTNPDYLEQTKEWNRFVESDKVYSVISGGKGRSKDIKNALEVIKGIAEDDDVILIHDATHPYVDIDGTNQVIEAIEEHGAATLGGKQFDTVYYIEDGMLKEVINRDNVVSGASPEGFKFGLIYDIYSKTTPEELDKMTSAGALALANNIKMAVVSTNLLNFKVTYPDDMLIMQNLTETYFFKEG